MLAKRQSTRDNSIESRKRSSIKESDFFSLNLRMLAIRKLQEKDDLHTVDASMVWQRLSAGYRIVDLRLNRFMQTLHFVLVHRRPKYSLLRLKDIRKFRSKSLLDRSNHPMRHTLVALNGNKFPFPSCTLKHRYFKEIARIWRMLRIRPNQIGITRVSGLFLSNGTAV